MQRCRSNGIRQEVLCFTPPIEPQGSKQLPKNYNAVKPNQTVWAYWDTGIETAPAIVKKCLASTKKMAARMGYDFVLLDKNNLHDYILLPDHIEQKHGKELIGEAHYSDILRISLLAEYGGIWADATLYASDVIPDYILHQPYFMFRAPLFGNASLGVCSSWFIIAQKGNVIARTVRDSLYRYWEKNNYIVDYFLFHLMLTWIVQNIKECKECWEAMPYISNQPPHLFMYSLHKPYSPEAYTHIVNTCFVHKLTYKGLNFQDKGNMLNHFLGEE